MTTLTERGKVLLSIPVDKELRAWLRSESKRRRLPQGVIVGRLLRLQMCHAQAVSNMAALKGLDL